jgi:hypothetical protein
MGLTALFALSSSTTQPNSFSHTLQHNPHTHQQRAVELIRVTLATQHVTHGTRKRAAGAECNEVLARHTVRKRVIGRRRFDAKWQKLFCKLINES